MSTEATAATSIDLHLHSIHSDGTLSPAALIERAGAAGLELLALTDHDTVAGLAEARRECAQRGIAWVAGLEASASWRGRTLHVLGLDIDPESPELTSGLSRLCELRRERMHEIGRRLERAGVPALALVQQIESSAAVMTRTHLARALVAQGLAGSLADAFKRFLGRGSPGHVPSCFPPLPEVIGWIRSAGGQPVLAHPLRYTLSAGARRQLLEEFQACGGTGIEVVCGNARAQIELLGQLAHRFGLSGSVGSDFHDPQIPWNPLGRLAKLPPSVSPVWDSFAAFKGAG